MKKSIKISLIVAVVIAVIVIAVAVSISPIAKSYIEKHDRELLGRSIRMEQLRMNIFTGRLRVEGLKIGGVDDSTTFVRLDSFDMRMRILPLLSQRVVVDKLHFTGPDVKIYQRGSEFNFDGILDLFLSDTTTVEQEPSAPWEIAINDISIRRGHIFYKDLELNATWGLNDVNLQIPGVYFAGEKTDVGAVLNFAEGGSLETNVKYDMVTSAFDIGLKLRDLTLGGTLPYFQQMLDVQSVDGRVSADIRLHGDVDHLLSVRTDGAASLAKFALLDKQQRTVIGVDTLHMKIAQGDMGKMRFAFDRIYVSGFSTLFELTPKGDNLSALMKTVAATPSTPAAQAPDAETATTPDLSLSVAELEIANSRIIFRDLTLEKPFEYTLSEIRMVSRDFDPAKRNNLTINARMQKKGQAKIRWEGTLEDMNNQNITLWLTNLDLRDFTPYCEHFTAYPITGGNISFLSQNVIRNRYLDGTNHLDAFEPKVDKKLKDLKPEMNIPLKVGLYVLKDKKGHVQMDLPVKGSLDSPEFSYRKIVLKAIGNVLLKVVTAPFSFLSGGKDNLEYISLDPQQYVFTSEQYASFDKIAQMMQDKPEMQIALTQRINLQRALPLQAASVLRMAYADHMKSLADSLAKLGAEAGAVAAGVSGTGSNAGTVAGNASQPRMSMLEYEKIQQMDIRTPAIVAFADSLLQLRGTAPQGLSANAKAVALYGKQATEQLTRLMTARDKAATEYMLTTHKITAPAFKLQGLDSTASALYNGRDRYTLALGVDGETVEISPADSLATDHVPAIEGMNKQTPKAIDEPTSTAAKTIQANPAPEESVTEATPEGKTE